MSILAKEPSFVTGLVVAVIAVLVAFNVPITDGQSAAIVGLVTAGLAIAQALATRQLVVSPETARQQAEDAYADGREDGKYVGDHRADV